MADLPTQFPVSDLDHHAARVFVGTTVALLILSLAAVTARILFKLRSKLLFALDDYLIVAGAGLAVATWAMLLAVIAPRLSSQPSVTLYEFEQVIKFGALAVPVDILSIACIKISVACLLLRFQQNRTERVFLYALIGVIIASHLSFFLFDLLQCIPLAASWDFSIQGARCVSHETFTKVSNSNTGITIATDFILSLFPITFLRQIRRPFLEKALIGVLMAMGLAASGVSVAKAVVVHQWASAVDSFAMGFKVSMLTCVELFIGIIAACSPSFKPIVQRLLASLGITFRFRSPMFRSGYGTPFPNEVPSGPLQEFNTQSDGTVKSHVFSFSEMDDLSKESTKVGVEGLASGSEQERDHSRASHDSHIPGDVV
ncbi:hypothetical protein N431DRAFT_426637 [Stipitochalara longipes BDJ]|nr:hypothetical protein N431DRAFT_426637 [Stipitochalara longipes BDJ]